MQVLVVEDDRHLADVLRRGLTEDGYVVDVCTNGRDALEQAEVTSYDAIVLDIMLPVVDGLELCRRLRGRDVTAPIIMVTARDSVDDIVAGLEAGADDYVTKPFAFRELRARLQSVMRRAGGATTPQLRVGDLVLDIAARDVRKGEHRVTLTNREYQVLEYLMHNRGRVLTRTMIENHVWGADYEGLSNTVDVHIQRLRRKIDRPEDTSIIETVRHAGYRLVDRPQ